MLTLRHAKAEPTVKFNAVEPGYTNTEFNAAMPDGCPVEESAMSVVRMATIGNDGPTGTRTEDGTALAW